MAKATPTFHRCYGAQPESVPGARRAVAAFAAEIGAQPNELARIRLAVSEAVTNAVLHGYRGAPGDIDVSAEVAGDELTIPVSDGGCGMQSSGGSPGMGVGLGLMAEVTDGMAIASRRSGGVELRMGFTLSAFAEPPVEAAGAAQVAAA